MIDPGQQLAGELVQDIYIFCCHYMFKKGAQEQVGFGISIVFHRQFGFEMQVWSERHELPGHCVHYSVTANYMIRRLLVEKGIIYSKQIAGSLHHALQTIAVLQGSEGRIA